MQEINLTFSLDNLTLHDSDSCGVRSSANTFTELYHDHHADNVRHVHVRYLQQHDEDIIEPEFKFTECEFVQINIQPVKSRRLHGSVLRQHFTTDCSARRSLE